MNIQVLADLTQLFVTELTCLFAGLYRKSSSGSHSSPRIRTHGHQSGSRDFALNFMHFVQCALSSSLIIALAETCTSTALVCPKHAVLSLSVLTSISGAAGSFCWRRLSSFVRSGMRETLLICNKYTFIQLSFRLLGPNLKFVSLENQFFQNVLVFAVI
ncbi:Hypothetical_protein [Hexamita inflata]|uniref:Hypothetical_protein n=1 Tax=Hexamita inflata TaxID=28002 RepID=A0AA86U2Y7_9EUKA|nr:Hypothetical protein HINF_LOCUS26144 [Hexamita inflata]